MAVQKAEESSEDSESLLDLDFLSSSEELAADPLSLI